MARSVKIVVTCASPGFRCAGRQFAGGDTEVVLEDLPDLSIEQQLAQFDHAKGGVLLQQSGLDRGMPEAMTRSPRLLTYRIVEDPPPAPEPEAFPTPEDPPPAS